MRFIRPILGRRTPEAKERAKALGIDIRYEGPDALAARVQKETAFWGQVIKSRNISAD